MGAVFELILYGTSALISRDLTLLTRCTGVYVVLFAGTIWVLRKRRRGRNAHTVSPVIDICSWFVFITLTIVSVSAMVL
jgi:hypothetical protein